MAWMLTDNEIAAVSRQDGPKRYSYAVKKAADQEVVWSLWHADGWALASDDQGQHLVPVWPHHEFARLCVRGNWTGYEPKQIELGVWVERWIPGMQQDMRLVAVFPTPSDRGVTVAPARFAEDLLAELSKYE